MSVSGVASVLADMHLLTVIAQTRNLTQAARRLGISKASVSTRLRDLERVVGMSLVRRTTRSVTLTAAALQLVDDTQASFARIEQSLEQAKDLAGKPRGVLRISAPVALGRQRIAPSVPDFLRRFPEIRLELDLNDRFVNIAQEGFDLAVRHARSIPDTYIARVLCESRSLLLASPDYLQRRGTPQHPSDLARHDCLLYLRDGPAQSWSFEKFATRKRGERVSVPSVGRSRPTTVRCCARRLKEGWGSDCCRTSVRTREGWCRCWRTGGRWAFSVTAFMRSGLEACGLRVRLNARLSICGRCSGSESGSCHSATGCCVSSWRCATGDGGGVACAAGDAWMGTGGASPTRWGGTASGHRWSGAARSRR